jgi:hypothetical protein
MFKCICMQNCLSNSSLSEFLSFILYRIEISRPHLFFSHHLFSSHFFIIFVTFSSSTSLLLFFLVHHFLIISSPFFSYSYLPIFFSSYHISFSLCSSGLDFSNYCDIGKASNRLINQQKQTLQYLQFFFFGEQIFPPAYVKLSDWSVDNLEYEQVRYAAYDALMCRQVYDEIRTRGTLQPFLLPLSCPGLAYRL